MKARVISCLALLLLWSGEAPAKTGVQFLQEARPPVFKEGHTLLPLTRWAWPLSFEQNVELAQRWGYALDINPGPKGEELGRSGSNAARMVALIKANPGRYQVAVNTRRVMFEWETAQNLLSPQAWCRDASGKLVLRNAHPVLKPYISDTDAKAIGRAEVARLNRLKEKGIKVDVVLNGAEYMPGVPGNERDYWRKDAEVSSWLDSLQSLTAAKRVDAFASNKARQEQAVRDAVLSVMPDSQLVYYVTGDGRRGIVSEGNRLNWAYPYRYLIRGGTIPSWEYYYGYFGSWMPVGTSQDHLAMLATNGVAQGIEDGRPLAYNWLSAGWSLTDPSKVSNERRYMGFLKYVYTLGSVGNVAGYFSYPPGGFNGDLGASAPDWLRQIMLLSHAHATFTHLEPYLRDGDLLPGDGDHVYSVDLYGQASWDHPAYEFVTNEGSPAAHVAARKRQGMNDWLIVAWAAAGEDRKVSVTIPELGKVTVLARGAGSLYRGKPGPALTLLDPAGMDPSRRVAEILGGALASKPSAPSDFRVD